MENSYQHIVHPSSCSEAEQTAHSSLYADSERDLCRSPLFSQAVSQHEYQPLSHQPFNQNAVRPCVESSSMQFNPLHSHPEQVHRFYQPSQQPPFTTIQGQLQIEHKLAAVDLHQLLGTNNQSHHLHETTHNTSQTWTHFPPQNDVSGQQKPLEMLWRLHPEVPSASVDSTCSTGNVRSDDWMSQAYAELQFVREMHLSELSRIYAKVCYACLQPSSIGQASKLEYNKGCIERMLQLLNTPRSEIVRFNKDKFYSSLYMLIKNVEKYKSSRGSVSTQPYAQSLSQLPLLRQWLDSSQAANPSSRGNASSPQFQVQEGSANSYLSKIELDHTMPVAGSIFSSIQIGSSGPSPLNTLQQTNSSPTTVPPNSSTSSPQLNRQAQKQMRHSQALNQLANQPSAEEKKHQMLIQRVKEINEKQQYEYSPRSLFPSPSLKIPWRETPLVSSGHMYPKQLTCPLPKASPSKSVTSPLVVASSSSPAMPSSSPICLEKLFSFEVRDRIKHPQTPIIERAEDPQLLPGESSGRSQRFVGVTLASIQNQLVALGTSEKPASLSLVDPTCLKENQRSSDNELSTKSLYEMVKSVSPITLVASVQDITSVITLMDTLSGKIASSGYLKIICEDLAADRVHRLERMTSSLLCKGTASNRMKRQTSISASCLSSSCYGNNSDGSLSGQPSNSELSETISNKRQRTKGLLFQLNDIIIEEIKLINQSLIETVVDVASGFNDDIDAIVRCSYSAVGLGHNLKQHNTSIMKLPILLVELLLPEDYPKSSPQVLNASSLSCSEAGKFEDLSGRAKLMFVLSLRKLSEPFTLRDMAEAWDYCARSVLSEIAQSCGGGSFSSKYGSWESCTTAV